MTRGCLSLMHSFGANPANIAMHHFDILDYFGVAH